MVKLDAFVWCSSVLNGRERKRNWGRAMAFPFCFNWNAKDQIHSAIIVCVYSQNVYMGFFVVVLVLVFVGWLGCFCCSWFGLVFTYKPYMLLQHNYICIEISHCYSSGFSKTNLCCPFHDVSSC